jgi:hypothetical protein
MRGPDWPGAPCPFCGSAEVDLMRTESCSWQGHCRDCSASGPACKTSEEARRRWGERAILPTLGKTRRATA